MPWFRFPPSRRGSGRVHRSRLAGLAAVVVAVALTVGCTDDVPTEPTPEASGVHRYVEQGNQTAYGDMQIGLGKVSAEGEAFMHVYADDAPENEVVTAVAGDTFQVGRRTVTVVRVDTDPEGVLLDIVDPEAAHPPDSSPSQRSSAEAESSDTGAADSGDNPMDDPTVRSVSLGRRVTAAPGLSIGLGTVVDGTAWILLIPEEGADRQEEVRSGDKIEMAGYSVTIVEVGDAIVYFRAER